VIDALNALLETHPRRGFWEYGSRPRAQGYIWNHKRIDRVYCALGLNQPRQTKRRLPKRVREPLFVPKRPDQAWSADFMSDVLYPGTRFRTFNFFDDFNREVLAIEIDTSLRAPRIIRVLDRLKEQGRVPDVLRVDNGTKFLSECLSQLCRDNRVLLQYIQPGKPNQKAYIERFNRTYRNDVLNLYPFRSLDEIREITGHWLIQYNDQRPYDALGEPPPTVYTEKNAGNSTLDLSA